MAISIKKLLKKFLLMATCYISVNDHSEILKAKQANI